MGLILVVDIGNFVHQLTNVLKSQILNTRIFTETDKQAISSLGVSME